MKINIVFILLHIILQLTINYTPQTSSSQITHLMIYET